MKPSTISPVMDRFLKTIEGLCSTRHYPQPTFPMPDKVWESVSKLSLTKDFICIAVGAARKTKQIPPQKIQEVLDELHSKNIILLGGPGENQLTKALTLGPKVINLVSQLSILESGAVISQARALLTGDTGMMHIAAALGTPIVAIFGSTHPDMGYAPYYNGAKNPPIIFQHTTLKCRPCTKHGKDSCPKGHFKCMEELEMSEVVQALSSVK